MPSPMSAIEAEPTATIRSQSPKDDTPHGEAPEVGRVQIKRRTLVISFLIALGLCGLAYGVGRLQAWQQIRAAETQATQAQEERAKSAAAADSERAELTRRVALLDARRQLHLVMLSMEERNFGIAEDHLRLAAQRLAAAGEPFKPVAEKLSALRLVATENQGDQRVQLVALAKQLDQTLDGR